MACSGSMRGEERFRRQSQRDLVRDRTGAGAEGETGMTGVGPPSQVTQKPTELLREHTRAQCLQAVDEQAHGGPLHVIDLVSIPITVVPKVQYFCSYFTSRPFLFHKFQVHTCLHHRVIITSPVSIHHHTVDPLRPLCPTPSAFLIVQENLLPHLGEFSFLKY